MVDTCRRIPTSRGAGNGRGPVRSDYTRFHWSLSVVVKRGPRAAIGTTRDEFWFTKTNSGIIDLMSNRNAFVRSPQPIAASSSLLIQLASGQAWQQLSAAHHRLATWDHCAVRKLQICYNHAYFEFQQAVSTIFISFKMPFWRFLYLKMCNDNSMNIDRSRILFNFDFQQCQRHQ